MVSSRAELCENQEKLKGRQLVKRGCLGSVLPGSPSLQRGGVAIFLCGEKGRI